MSLLLAVTQERISKICVPSGAGNIMLPCRKQTRSESEIKHFTKVMIWNLSSMNDLWWGPHRRVLDENENGDVPPSPPPDVDAVDSCPSVCFLIE